ncbi:hypothetical protein GCM10010353_71070 [Streptomyces chryseus]|uniref:hypothetical protein n=1 Tax=Streptomyces chryseus TaxID=68186 RepID=UPI0019CA2163|nr:hypothetical protein GCM10010353_71070 [Streptomyces chryseus]
MPELVGYVVPSLVGWTKLICGLGMESVLARVAGRFYWVDLRWRMRGYVRGLLAPVERKNGWQLAEYAGHRGSAGFQHLLSGASWGVRFHPVELHHPDPFGVTVVLRQEDGYSVRLTKAFAR